MQDLDSKPAGVSVGIPKVNIPFKGILVVIGALVFLAAIYFMFKSSIPEDDDSALWNSIRSVNDSMVGKQWVTSNINSLSSRLDQVTTQFGIMKNDITSIKSDLKDLKNSNMNTSDSLSRLRKVEDRLSAVEANLTKLGNLSWISGFPVANSSIPVTYLCDITGVPAELKFQYKFQCTCDLRKSYGPYLNVGAACIVNRDNAACTCYNKICSSQVGLC